MYEIENFWIYQKDFNTVAKFCMEMFESELKENDTLHQMDINCGVTSENEIYVTYYFREDTKSTELVPIDQTFYKSFKKVKQAFNEKADGKHYRFTNIIVYENFVRFDTYGPYRIYYSKNGTRPSLSNYYFFDRIRFHWYQAIYL